VRNPGARCSWSPRYAHWRPGAVHGWPSPTAMGSRRGDGRRTAVSCSVDDQLGRVGRSRVSALERQSAASTTAERGTPLRVLSLRKSPHDVSCHSVPRRVASVGAMADSRGLGCLSRELGGIATTSFVGDCDAGRRSPRAVVSRRARTAASATWPVAERCTKPQVALAERWACPSKRSRAARRSAAWASAQSRTPARTWTNVSPSGVRAYSTVTGTVA
jgi:hypothetical protein